MVDGGGGGERQGVGVEGGKGKISAFSSQIHSPRALPQNLSKT